MEKIYFLFILVFSFLFVFAFDNVYGHGVGGETLPPVEFDGRLVTLQISSSQSDPNAMDNQQISISLIDFNSKNILRDVTFLIKSERGEKFLFEQEFKANNGLVSFNFISENTDSIIIEEEESSFFSSLLGPKSNIINVKGPKLSDGGLYKFDIKILTAYKYSKILEEPLVFNAGISIAQTTRHDFVDPNFGEQNITITTYYDEISDFQYDPNSKEITFSMPFEWNESNINQIPMIHEELGIPKRFGDLLVSGFTIEVNGVKLSKDVVIIDDYVPDTRIVHFMISQKDLLNIFENTSNVNEMDFVIKPDRDYTHLRSVTDNGQFKILVSMEPENLKSDSNAKIIFDVSDTVLRNRLVAVPYEFSVTQNDRVIFEQSGISTDSIKEQNIIEFMIPQDVTGIINLNFKNLDNNNYAKTTIPIVVNRVINQNDEMPIPDWIKNNAGWWADGSIDDSSFIQGIQFLIKEDILKIPSTTQGSSYDSNEIPSWIKNNAGWWAEGSIDDDSFIQGLEFLVQNGIIKV